MKSAYCLFVFFLFCFSNVNVSAYFINVDNSFEANDQDRQLVDSLFKAAACDDLETVKKILESNNGFIKRMRNCLTLLHIAAIAGSLNVIEYLVREQNINIDSIPVTFNGLSPLGEAAEAGKLEAVKLLLEMGADKNIINFFSGNTLLHLAAVGGDIEVCKFLLQTFHVDVRNRHGETPAYIAAGKGNLGALRFLLENGADPDARDSYNRTLMHAAVMSGQADVVRELTRYKQLINTPDKWDDLPIDIMSNMEVAEVLVDAGSNITDKCIRKYILAYKIDIVKYLVKKSGKGSRQMFKMFN